MPSLVRCFVLKVFGVWTVLQISGVKHGVLPEKFWEFSCSNHCSGKFDECSVHLFCNPILWRWIQCSQPNFYTSFIAPCCQFFVDKFFSTIHLYPFWSAALHNKMCQIIDHWCGGMWFLLKEIDCYILFGIIDEKNIILVAIDRSNSIFSPNINVGEFPGPWNIPPKAICPSGQIFWKNWPWASSKMDRMGRKWGYS